MSTFSDYFNGRLPHLKLGCACRTVCHEHRTRVDWSDEDALLKQPLDIDDIFVYSQQYYRRGTSRRRVSVSYGATMRSLQLLNNPGSES